MGEGLGVAGSDGVPDSDGDGVGPVLGDGTAGLPVSVGRGTGCLRAFVTGGRSATTRTAPT